MSEGSSRHSAQGSRAQHRQSAIRSANNDRAGSHGSEIVYVGDIGGTNARLSAWQLVNGSQKGAKLLHKQTFKTMDFPTFVAVLDTFMSDPKLKDLPRAGAACFAVAGEVQDNRSKMTNIDWMFDGDALTSTYGFCVQLLNDFEAVGHGITALDTKDVVSLNNVRIQAKGPKVVMGPGTGLGVAQLMWDNHVNRYTVYPGEGAHATFAPRGWKQQALAQYVTSKHGYCEIEQVACGSGLHTIYQFLQSDQQANRPQLLRNKTDVQTPAEVSMRALDGSDPIAQEAVDMFLAIVGAEAGAMALRSLARGGVYIAGGITPKLMERVMLGGLLDGFLDVSGRPRFHQLLQEIPLMVVTNEGVGQMGALEVAAGMLKTPRSLAPRHNNNNKAKAATAA